MPPECCGVDYDAQFNDEDARRDLADYREKGPDASTQWLIDALVREGVAGATLLDIGGGIGAIQLELLEAGVVRSLDVDASGPFLAAAESEARERGWGDQTAYLHGDFTAVAEQVEPADIVTLDRVICCYPDARALIGLSSSRASRLYGLVHPVDRWWTRLMAGAGNIGCRLFRNTFRLHVHRQALIDALLHDAGFELSSADSGWFWRTAVYRRAGTGSGAF
jgi:magnesium-protoporphyrin O-methyltransferase